MDEDGFLSDAEVEAIEAWDRQQRSKKRRVALCLAVCLVVAFTGATVLGRSNRAEAAPPQPATDVARG